jgi:hypothetical protein
VQPYLQKCTRNRRPIKGEWNECVLRLSANYFFVKVYKCELPCGKHSDGFVRNATSKRMLKATTNSGDYAVATLQRQRKLKQYFVHRLVLFAFIGEPSEPDMSCDHINGVKDDNRLINLRWATAQEQMANRARVLSISGTSVLQVSIDGVLIQRFDSKSAASRALGVKRETISQWITTQK